MYANLKQRTEVETLMSESRLHEAQVCAHNTWLVVRVRITGMVGAIHVQFELGRDD